MSDIGNLFIALAMMLFSGLFAYSYYKGLVNQYKESGNETGRWVFLNIIVIQFKSFVATLGVFLLGFFLFIYFALKLIGVVE
jgi:hypothetical protein